MTTIPTAFADAILDILEDDPRILDAVAVPDENDDVQYLSVTIDNPSGSPINLAMWMTDVAHLENSSTQDLTDGLAAYISDILLVYNPPPFEPTYDTQRVAATDAQATTYGSMTNSDLQSALSQMVFNDPTGATPEFHLAWIELYRRGEDPLMSAPSA